MNFLEMRKLLKNPDMKNLHERAKVIDRLKNQISKTHDTQEKVHLLTELLEITEVNTKEYISILATQHTNMARKALKLANELKDSRKTIEKLEKARK